MAGIYLHIPYCIRACSYCDFHFSTRLHTMRELINAMMQELKIRQSFLNGPLDTIYFGGGTPGLLPVELVEALMEHIAALYPMHEQAEISFEINPENCTPSYLAGIRKAGINRLSIGCQSFIAKELQWMNRHHSPEDSIRSVKMAQHAGFDNISIDLIYGSRFQTKDTWPEQLQKALDLGVQHISSYNLTIEGKTLLGHQLVKLKEPPVDDDFSAWCFNFMADFLTEHRFVHYEISNFGLEGKFSRHNSSYWKGLPYLGIGPSAHSYDGKTRFYNVANNPLYIRSMEDGSFAPEADVLDDASRWNEAFLIGLRTMWGVDLQQLESGYPQWYNSILPNRLAKWEEKGFVKKEGHCLVLTQAGKLYADAIASDLFV